MIRPTTLLYQTNFIANGFLLFLNHNISCIIVFISLIETVGCLFLSTLHYGLLLWLCILMITCFIQFQFGTAREGHKSFKMVVANYQMLTNYLLRLFWYNSDKLFGKFHVLDFPICSFNFVNLSSGDLSNSLFLFMD